MTMTEDYPRDLTGYGAVPPHAQWPQDARIAVQFVINYEEGGENCILHGDEASEAFLSEIVGADARKGVRHMNMESIYEYGSRAGVWRLHRMLTQRGTPAAAPYPCCRHAPALGAPASRSPRRVEPRLRADPWRRSNPRSPLESR